jgi:hypothetical protein
MEFYRRPTDARCGFRTFGTACVIAFVVTAVQSQQLDHLQQEVQATGVNITMPVSNVLSSTHGFSLLRLMGTGQEFSRNVVLRNSGPTSATITDISLRSQLAGIGVTTIVGAELPLSVNPGGTFEIRIRYISPNNEFRTDTLLLASDDGHIDSVAIRANTEQMNAEELGLGRREITMTVTPDQVHRSINVNLYRYVGDVAFYTTGGICIDVARNVRSYVWHQSIKKQFQHENEYIVKASCTDGGYSFTRVEHVSFAGK